MIKILRKALPLLLVVIMILSIAPTSVAHAATTGYATQITQKVSVNGKSVFVKTCRIECFDEKKVYVKVRDIANIVKTTPKKFSVSYNSKKNTLTLKPGASYTVVGGENKNTNKVDEYDLSYYSNKVYKNKTKQSAVFFTVNKEQYMQIESLASILNFSVDLSVNYNGPITKPSCSINTKKGYEAVVFKETVIPTPVISDPSGVLC